MSNQITSKLKDQLSQAQDWLMPKNDLGPVQKAHIIVLSESGTLYKKDERIPVMYNPTTLKYTRTVEYEECAQTIQTNRVRSGNLTVTLFFDTFEAQTDVREEVKRIVNLTEFSCGPDTRRVPPTVALVWDKSLFTGIVTNVEQTHTMFLPTGRPVRATLMVTFTEDPTRVQREANAGGPACRMRRRVRHDDRLYLIAQEITGNSANWPQIAAANNIRNVLDFPSPDLVGKWLIIPDFHDETNEPLPNETYA